MCSGPGRGSAPSTREQAVVDAGSSGRTAPSPVLTAACTLRQAASTISLDIGRDTTADELDRTARALGTAVHRPIRAPWTEAVLLLTALLLATAAAKPAPDVVERHRNSIGAA